MTWCVLDVFQIVLEGALLRAVACSNPNPSAIGYFVSILTNQYMSHNNTIQCLSLEI